MIAYPTRSSSSPAALLLGDRFATIAALIAVTLLSWLYLWQLSEQMPVVDGFVICFAPGTWSATGFALTFVMWWVMMIGMMLPSAIPMLLTFATVNRRKRARHQPYVPTAVFAAGYLLAWGVYALAAALVQGGLEQAALMSPEMQASSRVLGGILLLAAGLYQFAPVKNACLEKCRSPVDFVLNNWRDGGAGALRMGLRHGFYCIGCCWMIMLLMFVGGVMNLLWAAAITGFVLAEKLSSPGRWVARFGGSVMTALGIYLLVQA